MNFINKKFITIMEDIEDFLKTKKSEKNKDFLHNEELIKENLEIYKLIINDLLEWIDSNKSLTTLDKTNELYNLFKDFFTGILRKYKQLKPNNSRKSMILYVLKNYLKKEDFNLKYYKYFVLLHLLLRKKPFKNVSGVTTITVITAPFPEYIDENGKKRKQRFSCKHDCHFCPAEPGQPRSYLSWEPAMIRAIEQAFTALGQMFSRLDGYYAMGHILDKLELIVEGGTFTEHPKPYLKLFFTYLFYAANIYWKLRELFPDYDTILGENLDFTKLENLRQPLSLEEEIKINKTADIHIIGICIETRPDAIDDEWLYLFRQWGITRIQLGAQHTNNEILKKCNRGHTVEQLMEAMEYLYDNCFKVDIHMMPDLPGSSPKLDMEMFDYTYDKVCPDQMKVYPCQVVPWTRIEKWYKSGEYIPYYETDPKALNDVIKYSMVTCPNTVRLPRVVRDIPAHYIQCGNKYGNLRQMIDDELDREGVISQDIRAREIGRHTEYYNKPAGYFKYKKKVHNGINYTIMYESLDKRALFGFIRLRIVNKNNNKVIFDCLKNRGLIRELHVYGDTTAVNTLSRQGCQHQGIGKGLLKYAEKITQEHGLYGIVVISGEGVKGYYEKTKYYEKDTFMLKDFNYFKTWLIYLFALIKYLFLADSC